MTKADFKTGWRVQYDNGQERIFFRDTPKGSFFTDGNEWANFKDYNDDLTVDYGKGYRIIKIWDAPFRCVDIMDTTKKGALLWTRPEPEEMIYLDEMGEVSKSTIKEALKDKFNKEA